MKSAAAAIHSCRVVRRLVVVAAAVLGCHTDRANGPADPIPDGLGLAFVSDRDGTPDIYLTEGRNVRRLTHDATHEEALLWSPDATRIAFSGRQRMWVVDADGSGPTSLTQPPESPFISDYPAAWSPDGTRLLYMRSNMESSRLRVINSDGTGDADVAEELSSPSWSPDGTRIAVLLAEGSQGGGVPTSTDVYIMNPDGSGRTNLTNSAAFESSPAWSPDGARIAFYTHERFASDAPDIYTMNPDGTGSSRLSAGGRVLRWSPDSRRIAWTSSAYDNDGSVMGALYTVDMTGSAKRVATVADHINSIAWAPSSDHLAFSTGVEPLRALFVVKIDGTGLVRIGEPDSDHHSPAWRPYRAP